MDLTITEQFAAVSTNPTVNGYSNKSFSVTGSSWTELIETVAGASTDLQINIAIDVSAVKYCEILSTRAMTIETNDGSSPANTLTLVAGYPYTYHANKYDTFKLTTDVTKFYCTLAAGDDATLTVRVLQDATP